MKQLLPPVLMSLCTSLHANTKQKQNLSSRKHLNDATLSGPQLPLERVTMETDGSHIPAVIGSASYITYASRVNAASVTEINNNNMAWLLMVTLRGAQSHRCPTSTSTWARSRCCRGRGADIIGSWRQMAVRRTTNEELIASFLRPYGAEGGESDAGVWWWVEVDGVMRWMCWKRPLKGNKVPKTMGIIVSVCLLQNVLDREEEEVCDWKENYV